MLLQFPNEISTAILSYLGNDDLNSARLVSHTVSLLVLPIYLRRNFTQVVTTLSKRDVERLETIASSEACRNAVCELQLNPWTDRFGRDLAWPRDSAGQLQQDGLNVQRLRKILVDSFPNCTKLEIVADDGQPWPNYWQSEEYLTLPDVINQVFLAVASPTPRIQSISLSLSPRRPKYCLEAVSPLTYESELFWQGWSRLRALRLNSESIRSARGRDLAQSLIANASHLKKLELRNCLRDSPLDGGFPLCDSLIAAKTLPKLSHLAIRGAYVPSSEMLVSLLQRFRESLEFLSLDWVTLHGDWKDVCRVMRGQFPGLRCFILAYPRTDSDGSGWGSLQAMCPLRTTVVEANRARFSFIESHDRSLRRFFCVSGVRYAGPDVDGALELIEKALYFKH